MPATTEDPGARTRAWVNRPLPAGGVLLAVYVLLSFGMDPGGYLGTDTGAKVATLEVMVAEGTATPDLGYWAEPWDPDGSLHPIFDTFRGDGGAWIHVTTLPMLEAARPLYALGGYRLALLLPMLGAVGAAFAARSIASRLDPGAGGLAFWAVGLLSPMTVYALDLWEHAPGVACMTGAVALLLPLLTGRAAASGHRWRALGAGALLGLAATMRTESFVYALVAVGAACLTVAAVRRALRPATELGLLAVAGFAVPWVANMGLERWVGGGSRAARATGAAAAGLGDLAERGREALITTLALRPQSEYVAVVIGGGLVVLLVGAALAARRSEIRMVRLALGGALLLHLLVLLDGLGFVPGLFAAAPVAVLGLLGDRRQVATRYVLAVAVGALPLVWGFQYLGGALPQWGGRYTLTSGALLVTLGCVVLHRAPRELRLGVLALGAIVTVSGVLWLGERSHDVSRLFRELVERPEDVIVVRNGFFVREGGAAYTERRWLTAVTDDDLEAAVAVVRAAGFDTFATLDESATSARLAGAVVTGRTELRVVGVPLYLHSYQLR